MSFINALIKEYNLKNSIIIIGNYPTFIDGKKSNISGISTYIFNLLVELRPKLIAQDRKIIVLADIVPEESRTYYEENGVLIIRCWKKNTLFVFSSLYSILKKFNNITKILVHFEYNTYGSGLVTGLFPLFLRRIHKKHKNVTLLIHQVVDSLASLSGHLGVEKYTIRLRVLNYLMNRFLWLLLGSVEKTVVHDSVLGDRLNKIRRTPVYVIPHGMIDNADQCDIESPRKELNIRKKDFVILVFGFLTWYKGSDWIVSSFKKYFDKTKDDSIKLILAGGKSANLKGQDFYEHYYATVLKDLNNYPNIIHTDFVPDDKIHEYYCAADIVIFPYRTHMSASGPLSYAMSFDRPFLISENIATILDTTDVKESLFELGLTKDSLVFKMTNYSSMFSKIMNLISDKKLLKELSQLSLILKQKRLWNKTADKFLFLIDA